MLSSQAVSMLFRPSYYIKALVHTIFNPIEFTTVSKNLVYNYTRTKDNNNYH